MMAVIGAVAALLQRQELVAEIEEGGLRLALAQREVEQAAVEFQRLVDVADDQGDVVEPDARAFFCSGILRATLLADALSLSDAAVAPARTGATRSHRPACGSKPMSRRMWFSSSTARGGSCRRRAHSRASPAPAQHAAEPGGEGRTWRHLGSAIASRGHHALQNGLSPPLLLVTSVTGGAPATGSGPTPDISGTGR